MLPKKNSDVEIGRNSSIYFAIGLNIMLFLSWQALEYKTYDKEEVDIGYVNMQAQTQEDIPVVKISAPAPPPPPPPAIVQEQVSIVEDDIDIEETIFESTETNQSDAIVEYSAEVGVSDVNVTEIEEVAEVPFSIIESVPVFPGCEGKSKQETIKCFNRKVLEHVKANFVYPEQAIDLGIQGRVNVVFIIDDKGYVTDIKSRGPDNLLQTEAERIISLLPKMKPGMQRGRPVKVNYAVPIVFKFHSSI
ncbi:energy transducer TonB [Aestuariibaculum sediminum]|uniref:Energy transducer TonB n=1 Tax=Aestuariibaculum sediminum TaxID=2770637 RepID=A0A8J6QBS9_9FLAO|nr:energy transducer TonB [Aestuariibaculum sediminum]MBD0833136.1 energy transducer TonB [Aestuariibaculum sediminum]